MRLKIDPGSKTTGLALVNDATGQVVCAAEIAHCGQQVKARLDQRRTCRCSRRHRHTRYRPARFANRARRRTGWLPPSLESRIANITTWVTHLQRWAPVAALTQELVRFDTQLMQDAEISGVEYQQRALAGYEVRVSAGKMAPDLRLLRGHQRAHPGGAYRAQGAGWERPGEQPDDCLCALQ